MANAPGVELAGVQERPEARPIRNRGNDDVDPGHRVAGVLGHSSRDTEGFRMRAEGLRALVPAAERDDALDGQLRCERVEMVSRLHSAPDETD